MNKYGWISTDLGGGNWPAPSSPSSSASFLSLSSSAAFLAASSAAFLSSSSILLYKENNISLKNKFLYYIPGKSTYKKRNKFLTWSH